MNTTEANALALALADAAYLVARADNEAIYNTCNAAWAARSTAREKRAAYANLAASADARDLAYDARARAYDALAAVA